MHMKSTRPVTTSVSASGPPRNGTWTAFEPGAQQQPLRRHAWRCEPADAKVNEAGLAAGDELAQVLMPFAGEITVTFGTMPNGKSRREKSRAGS